MLIITTMFFISCGDSSRSHCEAIMNFSYSENDSIHNETIGAIENCHKKYHKNIDFLQKSSQIYYLNAINKYATKEYSASANNYFHALNYLNQYLTNKEDIKKFDYQFRAEVYERLGDLYNELNTFKPTAELYDKALEDYKAADNKEKTLNMLIKIGKLYRLNHIPNIAMLYFEMAEEIENIPLNLYRKIIDNKLITLYELGDYKTADSIFNNHFSDKTKDLDYHSAVGTKYFYERNYEKALPHLTYCFDNGSLQDKLSASEKLAEVHFNINNNDEEMYFIQYQANVNSNEIRRTPIKLELEELFDSYNNSSIADNTTNKKSGRGRIILIIAILILVVAVISLIIKKKYYQEKITEAEKTINDSHKTIQKKEKIIKDISKKLEDLTQDTDFDKAYQSFCDSDIYKKVKNSLDGVNLMIKNVNKHDKFALSSNELIVLTRTFNDCFPNVFSTMKSEYKGITNSDSKYIILFLMEFSDVEIAVLLGLTYSATNKRSNKIKDIFGVEDDLSQFIADYIKSKFYGN